MQPWRWTYRTKYRPTYCHSDRTDDLNWSNMLNWFVLNHHRKSRREKTFSGEKKLFFLSNSTCTKCGYEWLWAKITMRKNVLMNCCLALPEEKSSLGEWRSSESLVEQWKQSDQSSKKNHAAKERKTHAHTTRSFLSLSDKYIYREREVIGDRDI